LTPELEEDAMSATPTQDLAEIDLIRELEHLHRTRHETFLHAAPRALREHGSRTVDLEQEYLRRHPDREVDPARTRAGARGDAVAG
jgi:hypothetical protein